MAGRPRIRVDRGAAESLRINLAQVHAEACAAAPSLPQRSVWTCLRVGPAAGKRTPSTEQNTTCVRALAESKTQEPLALGWLKLESEGWPQAGWRRRGGQSTCASKLRSCIQAFASAVHSLLVEEAALESPVQMWPKSLHPCVESSLHLAAVYPGTIDHPFLSSHCCFTSGSCKIVSSMAEAE